MALGYGILLVPLLVAALIGLDEPLRLWVREHSGGGWRVAAGALSRYGDFPFLLLGGVAGLALALRCRRQDWIRIIVAMLLASIVAGLASNVIKAFAGRVRPRVEKIELGWYGPWQEGRPVGLQHEYQSFPSSHAACAFGFFFPLFFSRRLLGTAGLLAAVWISWSRVYLNAHYLSDVTAGALVGLLAGFLIWRWIVLRGGLSRWLNRAVPG